MTKRCDNDYCMSPPISLFAYYQEVKPLFGVQYGKSFQAMASHHNKLQHLHQMTKPCVEASIFRQDMVVPSNMMTIFCCLSTVHTRKHQPPEAISYFEQALVIRKLMVDEIKIVNMLQNMGNKYAQLG